MAKYLPFNATAPDKLGTPSYPDKIVALLFEFILIIYSLLMKRIVFSRRSSLPGLNNLFLGQFAIWEDKYEGSVG